MKHLQWRMLPSKFNFAYYKNSSVGVNFSKKTPHDMLHSLISSWLSLPCFIFMPAHHDKVIKNIVYNENKIIKKSLFSY
jgi:hypothetical protein